MNVDESDFERRYADLSDEGLLSINREDLIDRARQCYDRELAIRGLQYGRTVIGDPPSREPFVSGLKSDQTVRTFLPGLPAPIRVVSALIGNFLVAALGTAISEGAFYGIYHPVSTQGIYAKEMILSAAIAFLLGGFVYYRRRSGTAKWIWIAGVAGLMWFVAGSWGETRFIPEWFRTWAVLSFISIRVIAYSAGAWVSAGLIAFLTDLAPHDSGEPSPDGGDGP